MRPCCSKASATQKPRTRELALFLSPHNENNTLKRALHLREIAQVVPFFAGISWESLGADGKQWPVTADGRDTQILHQDSFTLGKGRFCFYSYARSPELEDTAEYPFILTTGRLLEHYNCGSMTRRTPNRGLVTKDQLLIHPDDATAQGIRTGDKVAISSRHGTTQLLARISLQVNPGVLFTTFHYPEIAINQITGDVHDLDSMTPEYRVVAVRLGESGT